MGGLSFGGGGWCGDSVAKGAPGLKEPPAITGQSGSNIRRHDRCGRSAAGARGDWYEERSVCNFVRVWR